MSHQSHVFHGTHGARSGGKGRTLQRSRRNRIILLDFDQWARILFLSPQDRPGRRSGFHQDTAQHSAMNGKKILVVEDDADSAETLEAYLRRDGFDVRIARDGAMAIDQARQWRPDLVLLDVMLPKVSGTDVLTKIRKDSDIPVIMVTAIGDEPDKLGALRYGADDYIVKPYSPKEVVARVFAVLRRTDSPKLDSKVYRDGELAVDMEAFRATVESPGGSATLDLTPSEFNILATLLKTPQKAFTRSEIIDACLTERDSMERVVDMHVHNLRKKLAALGVKGVLVTVRAIGYRFR